MSLLSPLRLLAALTLLVAAGLAACDEPTPPPQPLAIAAAGTLQRGAIVTLSATRGGQAVPAAQVSWAVTPAAAGELLAGGQVRLLAAGTVTVSGSYDGSTGSTQLTVAEPPPPPPGALSITATGTLERGKTVQLSVTRDGQAVPAGNVAWTLVPAAAGEVLAGGQIRLLAAGVLEVRGTYDGSTGTTQLHVAEPPPLVLSATGRLERGSTILVSASRGGQGIAPGGVTLTVLPAGAGEVLGNGQVRLLAAGDVQVQASYELSTGTMPLTVAVPPMLVFDMSVGGNRDLYRVALDGGDFTRLTETVAGDSDPSVAAGKILFVSVRDGNPELYLMPASGGAATRVTTTGRTESSPPCRRTARASPTPTTPAACPASGRPTPTARAAPRSRAAWASRGARRRRPAGIPRPAAWPSWARARARRTSGTWRREARPPSWPAATRRTWTPRGAPTARWWRSPAPARATRPSSPCAPPTG